MLAQIHSAALLGIEAFPLSVEVNCRQGPFKLTMVGLPDLAVKESKDRVLTAICNSRYRLPRGPVIINLAPADMRKEGSALDLPIAVGMLAASEQLSIERAREYLYVGELALDGSLRPVSGALSIAIRAREEGLRGVLLPAVNAEEAGVVKGIDVIPVNTLCDAVEFIAGKRPIEPLTTDIDALFRRDRQRVPDLSDVKGQAQVKRALTVAAAGNHNLLMVGPPGTGKTMLAARLPGILPDLTFDEALATTRVYSAIQANTRESLITRRPFRAPHHTATTASMAGGGSGTQPHPGEVSLAHHGVLFLDELPEFQRATIEVLRQPLEDGIVHIRRAQYSVIYPSRFMLVAAMNPCPCGCRTDPRRKCRCSLADIQRYIGRVSGPLLDRIDIHIEVPALSFDELADTRPSGPTSAEVRAEVQASRQRQIQRHKGAFVANAQLDSRGVRTWCALNEGSRELLECAMMQMGLSARAYDKILRVSRTIADLECAEHIQEHHVAEAVQYRSLDRQYFDVTALAE